MKIAVIGAKGLPAQQGGVEHHCSAICTRMVARGHEVVLFARPSYNSTSWCSQTLHEGVKVVTLPSLPLRGMDAFINSALAALCTIGGNYDVVFFHALGPSFFSWIPRLLTSSKVISVCHGLDWQRDKWGKLSRTILRMGEKNAVRFAHDIITVSHELQSYFSREHERKTAYIPNAPAKYDVSDPSFTYGKALGLKPGKYVLFLGRLVPEKCPDLLLQAFVRSQLAGWKLVFVGGGSDTEEFATMLQHQAKARSDVVFTGQLKGEFLAEIVRGAGIFALPSNLEGLPLAMLEAMREGIPVLASDIPVHLQLLGQDRGVLFKSNDLEACADALNWSVRHPEVLAARARNAQHHIQRYYDWEGITTETLNLCARLLGESFQKAFPRTAVSTQRGKYSKT